MENKTCRIPRSEDELRAALSAACHGTFRMCVPAQADDHDMVLSDGIMELMFARAEIARLRAGLVDLRQEHDTHCRIGLVAGEGKWARTLPCTCGAAAYNVRIDTLLAGSDAGV